MNELPWSEWIKICLGVIKISKDDFWDLSFEELFLLIEGFKSFHTDQKNTPLSRNEFDELRELYPD